MRTFSDYLGFIFFGILTVAGSTQAAGPGPASGCREYFNASPEAYLRRLLGLSEASKHQRVVELRKLVLKGSEALGVPSESRNNFRDLVSLDISGAPSMTYVRHVGLGRPLFEFLRALDGAQVPQYAEGLFDAASQDPTLLRDADRKEILTYEMILATFRHEYFRTLDHEDNGERLMQLMIYGKNFYNSVHGLSAKMRIFRDQGYVPIYFDPNTGFTLPKGILRKDLLGKKVAFEILPYIGNRTVDQAYQFLRSENAKFENCLWLINHGESFTELDANEMPTWLRQLEVQRVLANWPAVLEEHELRKRQAYEAPKKEGVFSGTLIKVSAGRFKVEMKNQEVISIDNAIQPYQFHSFLVQFQEPLDRSGLVQQ